GYARCMQCVAASAEHRTIISRLRGWQRCVRVAHDSPTDEAVLDDELRLGAKESWFPEDEVSDLADLDRAQHLGNAVGLRRIDRDLGDVTKDPEVVVARRVFRQFPTTGLHCVGGLDAAQPTFPDATHRL